MTATSALVAVSPGWHPPIRSGEGELVACLDNAVQAIEGAFLGAGDVLSAAVDGVGELIAGLDRLTAAIDPEMVASTTEDLARAAASLDDLPHILAERRRGLEGMVERGNALASSVADMKQSLGYLRVFTIYVKVAAAGIPGEAQQFSTFADEISGCIEAGFSHVAALHNGLDTLDRSLRLALGLEGDLAIRCASMLPTTPDAIVATAAALASHRSKVASAAGAVRTLATGVRSKVGRVLAALQVGDSSRQRLEHIRDGLMMLDGLVVDLEPDSRVRVLAIGRELLNALLSSASEDFHNEINVIGRNMAGLATDATEILGLLDAVYGRVEEDEGGFLGRLKIHVGDALGLVGEVRLADGKAAELGFAAADAALGLIARIDDIQRLQCDVQQMALNTRLKCSRIGADGQSLAVIALELREQATQLESSAAKALQTIGDLERGARQLVDAVTRQDGAGAQVAADALNGVMARIQGAGAGIDADQRTLARLGTSVVTELRSAASGIDFKVVIGAVLDDARRALAAASGGAQPCSHDIATPVGAFFVEMARHYTMVQERSVHHVVAAALGVGEGASIEEAPTLAEDLDDLLF